MADIPDMLTPLEVSMFARWFRQTAERMTSLRAEQKHEAADRCVPDRLIKTMRRELGDARMILWFGPELRGLLGFTDRLDDALAGLAHAH